MNPAPAAPVFVRYKSELKARVILDLRAYNTLFPPPPPFHLPNLSSLLQTHPHHTQFFIKLDISNFFWSLLLPHEVTGFFTFAAGDTQTYGTRRLPFGWSWSPIIAQLTLARILAPVATWFPGRFWQYVDDILIADEDPHFLHFTGSYLVHLLARSGLVINSKSQLQPVKSLTWLGKRILGGAIINTPQRIAQGLAHVWALRTRQLAFRALQRCLGTLQWLLSPTSTYSPFLASSYTLLRQHTLPRLLPKNIWYSLLQAALATATPLHRRPLAPPLAMPLVFCDAAPASDGCFLVAAHKPRIFATCVCAPRLAHSVQDAELYGIFHTLRQMIMRRHTHTCVL